MSDAITSHLIKLHEIVYPLFLVFG